MSVSAHMRDVIGAMLLISIYLSGLKESVAKISEQS